MVPIKYIFKKLGDRHKKCNVIPDLNIDKL